MKTEFFTAKTSAENNIQARRSPVALASGRMAFSLAIASILLTACVSIPVQTPQGPGGDVVSVQKDGFTINEQGYRHLISEGARFDQFQVVPGGYFITNGQWHDINQIRVK